MKKFLYEQIYKKIISDIQSERLVPGQKIASVRKYAEENGISCNTVSNAYSQLVAEGYIVSKEKSGYFVADFEGNARPSTDNFLPSTQTAERSIASGTKADKITNPSQSLQSVSFPLNLSSNLTDSSFFPYTTLRRIYRKAFSPENDYLMQQTGDFCGDFFLRKAISDFIVMHRGVKCTPEQIIIGSGTAFLLQQLARLISLNGRKNVFFMENPCYQKNLEIIKDTGANIEYVPLDNDGFCLEKLRSYNYERTFNYIMHITPSHQFPMGITMPATRRSSILSWIRKAENRFIIEDDYDNDFRYKGHVIPSLQGNDSSGRVIYMGTFSRTLTPAMRISYMVLPEQFLKSYRSNFSYYTCTVSRIEQYVLAEFIHEGYFERHISRARKIYRERRDFMMKLLREYFPLIKISGEETGLHFIIQIPSIEENELIKKTAEFDLKISGTGTGWIIIGYAHLEKKDAAEAVQKLALAASECL